MNANEQQIAEDRLTLDQQFRNFQSSIDMALMMHEEYIEASPEIMKHFNPRGLNGAGYFIYKGIKVVELNKTEEVNRKLKASISVNQQYTNGITIEGTHE